MRRLPWIAVLCCFVFLSCLEAPLGTIAAAKIDHRLDGVWIGRVGAKYEAWMIVPLDEHVDCIVYSGFEIRDGKPVLEKTATCRGWITPIAGSTFLSLEPVAQLLPEFKQKRTYYSVVLDFDDAGGLEVRGLNYKFKDIAHIEDAGELTRFVEANIQDPNLLGPSEQYHRPDPTNELEKAIAQAYLGKN